MPVPMARASCRFLRPSRLGLQSDALPQLGTGGPGVCARLWRDAGKPRWPRSAGCGTMLAWIFSPSAASRGTTGRDRRRSKIRHRRRRSNRPGNSQAKGPVGSVNSEELSGSSPDTPQEQARHPVRLRESLRYQTEGAYMAPEGCIVHAVSTFGALKMKFRQNHHER